MKKIPIPWPAGLPVTPTMERLASGLHVPGHTVPRVLKGCWMVNPQDGNFYFKRRMEDTKAYCVQEMVELLEYLAGLLRKAEREGADVDVPEGTRYIRMSETAVNKLTEALENGRRPAESGRSPGDGEAPMAGTNEDEA